MEKAASKIYFIFLVIACIIVAVYALSGIGQAPESMFLASTKVEITPLSLDMESDTSCSVTLDASGITAAGGCLSFTTSFSDVYVYADETPIYENIGPNSRLMRSNGNVWHFISIPDDSKEILVKIEYVYDDMSVTVPEFTAGDYYNLKSDIVKASTPSLIVSILDLLCGIGILIYFSATRGGKSGNNYMLALGVTAVCMGLWSAGETNAMVVLFTNRSLAAVFAFLILIFLPIPYVRYVHSIMWRSDRFLYLIPVCLCLFDFVLVTGLSFAGIMDLKETVKFTHLAWGTILLYAVSATFIALKNRKSNDSLVTINAVAMILLIASTAFDLVYYWTGARAQNDVTGRILILCYIFVLAYINIHASLKDIEKGKMAEYYRRLANTDSMTGLANRTAFNNDLNTLETDTEYTLISMDLNNLKKINDSLGHQAGDRYIINAANIISKVFGKDGICYRIGGDEFSVIIRNPGSDDIAKRLIVALEKEMDLHNSAHPSEQVAIALGYESNSPASGRDHDEIIHFADEKMYENKRLLKSREK